MMYYHKIIKYRKKKTESCISEEHVMGRLDAFVCNYSGATEQNALESWNRFSFHDWLIKLNQADLILEQSGLVIKFTLEKHQANIIFKRYGLILCQINRVPCIEKYPSLTPV